MNLQLVQESLVLDAAGVLRWRVRPLHHFSSAIVTARWNGRYAGKVAGRDDRGYRKVSLCNKPVYAHRIIYFLQTGIDPADFEIDHIDGNASNNHPTNLRLATRTENNHNQVMPVRNTSGVKGVGWSKAEAKWRAQLVRGGKTYSKFFASIEDAACWVRTLRDRLDGPYARHA